MNDKDFDKIFSKKLKEEKSLPIDERSWEALALQLDKHDQKKGVDGIKNRRLAWLLPFLLLLLGVNVWSLMRMNQSEKQNVILRNELKELKTTLLKRDTIIQTQYIYKTDTIYIRSSSNKSVDKNLSSTLNQRKEQLLFSTHTSPSVSEAFFETKTTSNLDKSFVVINNNNRNEIENKDVQKDNFETLKPKNNIVSLAKLPLLKGRVVEEKKAKPEIILLNYTVSTSPPIIENKKTNRFYFGTSAGFVNYHTLWFNKDGLEIGRNEKSYQIGLKIEYALTNNWRVTASADYCPYNFNIKWLDNRYNLPPKPNYFDPNTSVLNSIVGSQKLYLGSIGVKYVLNQNSRWQPYVGTSYTAMRIEPYNAEYTFTHLSTAKQYSSKTELQGGADIMNIALLNGGIEYRFNKHIVAQTEGFYYKDMNKVKKTFDLFGLRGAILVGF